MKKQSISYLFIAILSVLTVGFAHSINYTTLFEKNGISVVKSKNIDTTFPKQPALDFETHGSAPSLSTLVSVKLVNTQDHHANAYVYFPTLEILVPIVSPSQKDNEKIFLGESFNHFPYLEWGALHYFGNSPKYGNSNMVLAAHSSFKKSDLGRRKTIGQAFALLDIGDEIHYYEKSNSNDYNFYQYIVQESFVTTPDDVSILQNTKEATLTAYTCRPFGTIENRLVIHADMVASYENHEKLDIIPKSIQSKTSNTLLFDNSSSNSETSHGSASSVKEEEFIIAIPDTKQIQTPIQEATNTNDNSELIDLLFQAKIPDIYKKENTAITESLQNIIKVYAFRYPKIHTAIRSLIRKKVEQHINTLYSSSDKKKSIELLIKYLVMYHSITP